MLIDASALVGTCKFAQMIGVAVVAIIADDDFVTRHFFNRAIFLRDEHHTAIHGGFVFHACADEGCFRHEQWHGLTLHVGAHQGARSIIIFKEGDHACCDRHNLAWANVDEVNVFTWDLDDFSLVTNGDIFRLERVILVEGFSCLCDNEEVFLISGHVDNIARDLMGHGIDTAIRCFNEAILIDTRIGSERTDQTDVGTFRRFNGADTGIMAVVNVTNFKRSAVTIQTTRTECRQTTLMGQFCQGVGLIHELRELRGSEELFNGSAHGADVDQFARANFVRILNRHTFTHHAFQTAQTNADLVLQKLANATQATVAEVIDIVFKANAIGQAQKVVDGGDDVMNDDVLWHKIRQTRAKGIAKIFFANTFIFAQNFHEQWIEHLLLNPCFDGFKGQVKRRIHKVIANDFMNVTVHFDGNAIDTCILNGARHFFGDALALMDKHFARCFIKHIHGGYLLLNTGC